MSAPTLPRPPSHGCRHLCIGMAQQQEPQMMSGRQERRQPVCDFCATATATNRFAVRSRTYLYACDGQSCLGTLEGVAVAIKSAQNKHRPHFPHHSSSSSSSSSNPSLPPHGPPEEAATAALSYVTSHSSLLDELCEKYGVMGNLAPSLERPQGFAAAPDSMPYPLMATQPQPQRQPQPAAAVLVAPSSSSSSLATVVRLRPQLLSA